MLDIRNDVKEFMEMNNETAFGFGKQSDLYMRLITDNVLHDLIISYDNNDLLGIARNIVYSIWNIDGFINTIAEHDEIVKINRNDIISDLDKHFKDFVPKYKERFYSEIVENYLNFRIVYDTTKYNKEYQLQQHIFWLLVILISFGMMINLPLQEIWDDFSNSKTNNTKNNIKSILEKHNLI